MNKPQPQAIVIWRILLFISTFAAAFLISVLFRIGSAAWLLLTCLLALAFLGIYIFYLPLLYKKMEFHIKNEKIIFNTGVFTNRVIAVPLPAIQFTTVSQTILGRLFGLSSVVITAAGGRMVIPGLKTGDAFALVQALKEG